jgi:hypothetical protein
MYVSGAGGGNNRKVLPAPDTQRVGDPVDVRFYFVVSRRAVSPLGTPRSREKTTEPPNTKTKRKATKTRKSIVVS